MSYAHDTSTVLKCWLFFKCSIFHHNPMLLNKLYLFLYIVVAYKSTFFPLQFWGIHNHFYSSVPKNSPGPWSCLLYYLMIYLIVPYKYFMSISGNLLSLSLALVGTLYHKTYNCIFSMLISNFSFKASSSCRLITLQE